MSCTLWIGEQREGFYGDPDEKVKRYRGRGESARLSIPSIEIAHEIAKLVGAKTYAILQEKDYFGTPIFQTQDITDWDAERKAEREKNIADNYAKVERANALPKVIEFKTYGNIKVYLERTMATYNPKQSHNVLCSVSIKKSTTDPSWSNEYISLENYRTQSGAWQRKKFFERYKQLITENLEFAKVWDDRELIIQAKNNFEKQIRDA